MMEMTFENMLLCLVSVVAFLEVVATFLNYKLLRLMMEILSSVNKNHY